MAFVHKPVGYSQDVRALLCTDDFKEVFTFKQTGGGDFECLQLRRELFFDRVTFEKQAPAGGIFLRVCVCVCRS